MENKGNQQQKEEFSDFSTEESYAKGCKLMDGKFHVNWWTNTITTNNNNLNTIAQWNVELRLGDNTR